MGIKTRYREKSEEIPASEKLNGEPAADTIEPATERLRQQLADLHRAEGFQRLVAVASAQASQEGHAPFSEAHNSRTRQLMEQHLGHVAQAAEEQPAPVRQPAPSPVLPPEPDRTAMYSAPVSREVTGGGYRESVRLTPEELQIAAASGISATQYAKNKLEMLRRQRTGEI